VPSKYPADSFTFMSDWQDIVQLWSGSKLGERQGYQQHFLNICSVLGEKSPAACDQTGETFTFEKHVSKTLGGKGFADVWKKNFFAWEYKRQHKNLSVAYRQLIDYRDDLENAPLLVVSDFERFEVHTCWNFTKPRKFEFHLSDLLRHEPTLTCPIPPQDVLRAVFQDPEQLRPEHVSAKVTEAAALRFSQLAEQLELEGPHRLTGEGKTEVAHFFMRLLFCLFADSVKLLPDHLFRKLVEENRTNPNRFVKKLRGLFQAMAKPDGTFGPYDISWFNGGLFDDRDVVLDLTRADLDILYEVSRLDWSAIEPAIFGTLFERSLDSAKRKLIGAHYTSSADIRLLIEPVMMKPLRERWMQVLAGLQMLDEKLKDAPLVAYRKIRGQMEQRLVDWIHELSSVRVLDPACGSGNFLYVALRELLDLWLAAARYAAERDLKTILPKTVGPHQLYGIESDFYAHQLASIVVWIGYLQWRHESGQGFDDHPVLKKLENIEHANAILRYDGEGRPYEPTWPPAEYIVGNPPFLGGNRIRKELGDAHIDSLFNVYHKRVEPLSDLVCYWFEKARCQIELGNCKRAGLLATQGIRGGANREVLRKIKQSGDIFYAFSDRKWPLDGAVVRISMIAFDNGTEQAKLLNERQVESIHSNLSAGTDTTSATAMAENSGICFMGISPKGKFDISSDTARKMLMVKKNVNGRPNSDVVRPVMSGIDIVGARRGLWTIDFGTDMTESAAAKYEMPFEYVRKHVYQFRRKNNRESYKTKWWLFGEPRPAMRRALNGIQKYIATPATAKHRIFVWVKNDVLCNQGTLVFARADDYFFGVLHSSIHELWARAQGTQLREVESGFRYTPDSTFDTFPFPWPPGTEPSESESPLVRAIADAVRELVRLRDAWLNPAGTSPEEPQKLTLTKLYNVSPTWLKNAHKTLDRAVLSAYGLEHPLTHSEILEFLLELNRERVAGRVRAQSPKLPRKKAPGVERLLRQNPSVRIVSR
jgi:type II restriction/modification system DNA methylase subunit YeeA